MWVLVLIVLYSETPAITHIDGFKSRDACVAAGYNIKTQTEKLDGYNPKVVYTCVGQ